MRNRRSTKLVPLTCRIALLALVDRLPRRGADHHQKISLIPRLAAILIVAGATAVIPAAAGLIYTNLGTGGTYNSGQSYIISTSHAIAQSFPVVSSAQFTDVQLAMISLGGNGAGVYLASDNAGQPGTILDSLVEESQILGGGSLVSFRCTTCPTLSAGTYWILAIYTTGQIGWSFNNTGPKAAAVNNNGSSTNGPWTLFPTLPAAALRVNGAAICSARSIPVGQWNMLSLPCAPVTSTVSSVFSGISGTYDTDWVVWERNESTNRYVKLGLGSLLTQGRSYWIKTNNAADFRASGTATPVTSCAASTNGCFEIPLTKPADSNGLYNLGGHPFSYDVNWSDVRVVVDGAAGVSPSQAASAAKLSKTFWTWNGSSYDSHDDVTPGLVGQLQPTYGMWVKTLDPNISSIKLQIPAASGQTGQAGVIKRGVLKASEWYVRLIAETAAEGLKDRGTVLGQLKDSSLGFDSHDLPELPPSFTPYLTVVFPHADWGAKKGDFASDFHAVKTGADSWSFVVRTDNPARQVRLSWEVSGKAPANISLRDVRTGKVTLLKAGSYTFVMGATERAFTWSVK